jgi:hypothetical protein
MCDPGITPNERNSVPRHRIQFPAINASDLGQDEAYFHLLDGSDRRQIRLHDYSEIYKFPGLYEQLFYDRLKCQSPAKVAQILGSAVAESHENLSELRVLDLGAGNGMMGEVLKKSGVSRLVADGRTGHRQSRMPPARTRPRR